MPDVIAIVGAHDLERAAETQRILVERLQPGARLVLDFSELTEPDLSLLQIVLAARRAAADRGGVLSLLPQPAPALPALAEAAGLLADETERRFWNGMPT